MKYTIDVIYLGTDQQPLAFPANVTRWDTKYEAELHAIGLFRSGCIPLIASSDVTEFIPLQRIVSVRVRPVEDE